MLLLQQFERELADLREQNTALMGCQDGLCAVLSNFRAAVSRTRKKVYKRGSVLHFPTKKEIAFIRVAIYSWPQMRQKIVVWSLALSAQSDRVRGSRGRSSKVSPKGTTKASQSSAPWSKKSATLNAEEDKWEWLCPPHSQAETP